MAAVRVPADENVIDRTDSSAVRPILAGLTLTGLVVAALAAARAIEASRAVALPNVGDAFTELSARTGFPSVVAESVKLASAALIGVLVTFVQRHTRRGSLRSPSMEHAQVLLCIAGALTMTIIDNSLARAFGIAGAASIIRFRTPVDDPREATVLFLLMALGMATGLGATGVALAGTVFVCGCLLVLRSEPVKRSRTMNVLVVANGAEFPKEHVAQVFADYGVPVEPIEMSRDEHAAVRYRAAVAPTTSLEELSTRLVDGPIKSVAWQASKKDL